MISACAACAAYPRRPAGFTAPPLRKVRRRAIHRRIPRALRSSARRFRRIRRCLYRTRHLLPVAWNSRTPVTVASQTQWLRRSGGAIPCAPWHWRYCLSTAGAPLDRHTCEPQPIAFRSTQQLLHWHAHKCRRLPVTGGWRWRGLLASTVTLRNYHSSVSQSRNGAGPRKPLDTRCAAAGSQGSSEAFVPEKSCRRSGAAVTTARIRFGYRRVLSKCCLAAPANGPRFRRCLPRFRTAIFTVQGTQLCR